MNFIQHRGCSDMLFNKFFGIIALVSLVVIGSHNSYAAVTSLDYVFVANDQYASDFYSRLNSNFTRVLNGGINSISAANIVNDSLTEANMADEINPRIRTYEGAACEFVYTGLIPVTAASLTTNTTAGTAYPRGFRINKASATAHTYTASKWTWVDIDQNGDFQYSEQAINSATPSIAANSIRLARVSTDSANVLAIQDLRITSCTNGPFNILKDASGEANLSDILVNGGGGFENGLQITTKDSHSVYINPGTIYINGKYRTVANGQQVTIDGATVASPVNGLSGIDTGALTANTNYYVYAAADLAATPSVTGILSTSATAPSGVTSYRRIGEVSTDASAAFSSSDAYSVSYQGKIRQIKKFVTGAYATGSTTIPADDTIPQITEGDEYMRIPFTAVSLTDLLKIDVVLNGLQAGSEIITACVFQDTNVNAIGCGSQYSANSIVNNKFTIYAQVSSLSQVIFSVRAGGTTGGIKFNGNGSARFYGGRMASSVTVTEFEN